MRRIILASMLAIGPALAEADPPPDAPQLAPPAESTARRHLGFFLRLDSGLGYLGSSASQGGVDLSISGFAIPTGVAVGWAVAENFILAGDLWASVAISPSVNAGGQSAPSVADSSLVLEGIGLNLTYYFMPHNAYVSVTPSVVVTALNVKGVSYSTQTGFGGKVCVGKEWWVGDHWGLGVAAQFHFGINKDNGTNPPTWTSLGGGLAFSATLN